VRFRFRWSAVADLISGRRTLCRALGHQTTNSALESSIGKYGVHLSEGKRPLPSFMKLLNSSVIRISIASILTGILIGLVGGAFRYCLIAANTQRDALIAWAHAWPHIGWLAPVALGLVPGEL
jgi:hypothetical protein